MIGHVDAQRARLGAGAVEEIQLAFDVLQPAQRAAVGGVVIALAVFLHPAAAPYGIRIDLLGADPVTLVGPAFAQDQTDRDGPFIHVIIRPEHGVRGDILRLQLAAVQRVIDGDTADAAGELAPVQHGEHVALRPVGEKQITVFSDGILVVIASALVRVLLRDQRLELRRRFGYGTALLSARRSGISAALAEASDILVREIVALLPHRAGRALGRGKALQRRHGHGIGARGDVLGVIVAVDVAQHTVAAAVLIADIQRKGIARNGQTLAVADRHVQRLSGAVEVQIKLRRLIGRRLRRRGGGLGGRARAHRGGGVGLRRGRRRVAGGAQIQHRHGDESDDQQRDDRQKHACRAGFSFFGRPFRFHENPLCR